MADRARLAAAAATYGNTIADREPALREVERDLIRGVLDADQRVTGGPAVTDRLVDEVDAALDLDAYRAGDGLGAPEVSPRSNRAGGATGQLIRATAGLDGRSGHEGLWAST